MFVTSNSTVDSLNFIHRTSVYIPHYIYGHRFVAESDYVSYAVMISSAALLVVFCSYATVSQPQSAQNPALGKHDELFDQSDKDGSYFIIPPSSSEAINSQVIDYSTAAAFPFIAGGALIGASILLQKLDLSRSRILHSYILLTVIPASISTLLYTYDSVARQVAYTLGLKGNSGFFFKRYRFTLSRDEKFPLGVYDVADMKALGMSKSEYKHYSKFMSRVNNVKFTKTTKVGTKNQIAYIVMDTKIWAAVPVSGVIGYLYYAFNPALNINYQLPRINWMVNNLIAVVLAVMGVQYQRLASFKVGALLLLGLFFYDIYFVFGSTRMMEVATGLDIPGKLLFPQRPQEILSATQILSRSLNTLPESFAILGLGDIVVPSWFISLCLRFDYFQYYSTNELPFHRLRSIGTPRYFAVAVTAYVFGLSIAVGVNSYSGRGQPALLYIVPCLIAGVAELAWIRGEFDIWWNYSEKIIPYEKKTKSAKSEKNGDKSTEGEDMRNPLVHGDFYCFRDEEEDYSYFIGDSEEADTQFIGDSEEEADFSYFIADSDYSDCSDKEGIYISDDDFDEINLLSDQFQAVPRR